MKRERGRQAEKESQNDSEGRWDEGTSDRGGEAIQSPASGPGRARARARVGGGDGGAVLVPAALFGSRLQIRAGR